MRFPMKIGSLYMALTLCVSLQAQTSAPIQTPNAIPSTFFGTNSNPVLSNGHCPTNGTQYPEATLGNVDTNFSQSPARFLGHDTTRFALWGGVEPSRGTYHWGVLDSDLDAAKAQGTQMILTILDTPDWAIDNGHGICGGSVTICNANLTAKFCTNAPASYIGTSSDWGIFIQAMMDHLKGSGYLGTVKAIELWNEANTSGYWGRALIGQDPDLGLPILVAMAQTAYPIIHNYGACYPNCPLVLTPSAVGAASGPPPQTNQMTGDYIVPDWIHRYLTTPAPSVGTTGKDYADGIAFHGYGTPAPDTCSQGVCTYSHLRCDGWLDRAHPLLLSWFIWG